jgi:GT2 family glycosyltransferase
MKLSVVICTYNRPELISECLLQLAPGNQSLPSDLYEVIVSDDNRNLTTQKIIEEKFPWVVWVKGPEKGFSANRNNGAKSAKGDWLLLLDDDCIPDKGWVEGYYNGILNNPGAKVFEGKTLADRPRERFDEESPVNEFGGKFWGCNQCVQKEFYFAIGGMPEIFKLYMEDVEFRVRINKHNQEIIFVKEALIIHPWRKVRPLKKQFQLFKNILLFIKLHPEERFNYSFIKLFKIAVHKTFSNLVVLKNLNFKGTVYYLGQLVFLYARAAYVGTAVALKRYEK